MIPFLSDWKSYKFLVLELFRRDLYASYKGTFFGIAWTLINSLFMLSIYTFLFSFVFKTKWGGAVDTSIVDFSIMLFAGLLVYTFCVEVLNRSPLLIPSHINFVKKLVFPLHVLAYIVTLRALFNFFVGFCVLVLGQIFISGHFHVTTFLLPLILLPMVMFSLGLVWLISALAVYVRDIVYFIQTITTVLMFTSPIFFPVSAIPKKVRFLIYFNPLTSFIEQFRQIVVVGNGIEGVSLFVHTIVGFFIMCFGYWTFSKLRKGFADVL